MKNTRYGFGGLWGVVTAMLVLALMFIVLIGQAQAAPPPALTGFGAGGSGPGANSISNFVVSANAANGGVAVITYLNVTGGNSDNVTKFYQPSGYATIATNANSTVTIPVGIGNTNGFAAGDIVVIRHVATDTYERRVLDTFANNYSLTLTVAPSTALVAGDVIYKMTLSGQIITGTAKEINNPGGLYWGARPGPVLLDVSGTSVALTGIQCVSGYYKQP